MDNNNRVVLFGASGFVGQMTASTLLTKGKFQVTCVMPNPGKFALNHAFARLEQGDSTNVQDVERVLDETVRAVVVAVGGEDNQLRRRTAEAVVQAMLNKGLKRVIHVAGAGILQLGDDSYLFQQQGFPQQYEQVTQDHLAAYQVYKASGLDYTLICPSTINDQPFTGDYNTSAENPVQDDKQYVGVGNVSDLILQEIKDPKYIGKRVGISDK